MKCTNSVSCYRLAIAKIALYSLLILCSAVACTQSDSNFIEPESGDPDWIKLEIPSGREAYAIAGDFEKRLLVTTWTKAYYTEDKGKTWHESKDFQGSVPGLLIRNDTTFSMSATSYDNTGKVLGATMVDYFTADYGKTWQSYFKYYNNYINEIKPIGVVKLSNNVSYSIRKNSTTSVENPSISYVNPSEIVRQDSVSTKTIKFPFKNNLLNLYMDRSNRLYVASSGGTYQFENNTFICCSGNAPAIVYISRDAVK